MPQNRLRELREAHGWTRQQLADWLSRDERQIYRYERGDVDLPIVFASRLSDLFGVSLDHLMGRDRPAEDNDAEPVAC